MSTISNHDHEAANGQSLLHAAIYQRQAAGQMRDIAHPHNDLAALARQQGYNKVSIFSHSGRTSLKEGSALSQLLQQIINPSDTQAPIRAIFAYSEDRLFRDAEGIDLASFMRICQEHHVTVVTPQFTYDFTDVYHIALFRQTCEEAQIFTRVMVRRLQAGRREIRQRRQEGKQGN